MDNTVGSLTQIERSIIIGSILGDGYLRRVGGRKDALLEINHSVTQSAYVDWKYTGLKSLCKSGPVMRRSNGTRIAYRFTTRQHPELSRLKDLFYINDIKSIPDSLILDPMTLAVWYMDDGSKCRESDIYLNTQQFSEIDQKKLIKLLQSIEIESSLNKDKTYKRIRIKKSSLARFFEIISPHVIPSMVYKLSYNPVETCSERSGVVSRRNG
jgi:hypothetical protein